MEWANDKESYNYDQSVDKFDQFVHSALTGNCQALATIVPVFSLIANCLVSELENSRCRSLLERFGLSTILTIFDKWLSSCVENWPTEDTLKNFLAEHVDKAELVLPETFQQYGHNHTILENTQLYLLFSLEKMIICPSSGYYDTRKFSPLDIWINTLHEGLLTATNVVIYSRLMRRAMQRSQLVKFEGRIDHDTWLVTTHNAFSSSNGPFDADFFPAVKFVEELLSVSRTLEEPGAAFDSVLAAWIFFRQVDQVLIAGSDADRH
jgi:hypothetical protein